MLRSPARHVPSVNTLFATISAGDGGYLASAVRSERPAAGQVLSSRTDPATEIWFPRTGIIALSITDRDGRSVQTGLLGSEGCAGLEALFPGIPPLADAKVQIAGE